MTNRSHQLLVLSLLGTSSTPCCSIVNASSDTNAYSFQSCSENARAERARPTLNVSASMPLFNRNVGCIIAEVSRATHSQALRRTPRRRRGKADDGHFLPLLEIGVQDGFTCGR